ncbi:type II toxin-antitoxin system mRNA interferase toxin, RelE/StbE family [Patescibacteria group bacterium]|nr:type II toxin-antitoxin system mRNA interferase toxin, RelE/StbE family [Patescibacteria group bacterium]
MEILYLPKFKKQYKKLPSKIKDLAEKKEKIFRKNPFNPKLETHRLHGKLSNFWAFSINYEYRIIFDFADKKKNVVRFYLTGKHDLY